MTTHVRTRIPPSPTGEPHIGNLRTALFNYLFAKSHNGDFILRIEDTDQTRSQEKYIFSFIESLNWAGIIPNEGPYIEKGILKEKGAYGPYIQSKRLELYKKYAHELLLKSKGYYCFCTPIRLEKMRKEQSAKHLPPLYDKTCRNLSKEALEEKLSSKLPYVIRLKMPEEGTTTFHDIIKGEVTFENKLIDDQIIQKADGFPTYHLANVIDDALMRITHVIRGEEWVSSTPKHIVLYNALELTAPAFAHLPLVLAKDKSKLSKRHGAVSITEFKEQGYLPEALVNFLALLGWNPGDERELFSLKELEKEFDLTRVQKAPAVFNFEKLNWMNKEYIKKFGPNLLVEKVKPYLDDELKNHPEFKKIILLFYDRLLKLTDLNKLARFIIQEADYLAEILPWKRVTSEKTISALNQSLTLLKQIHETSPSRFIAEHLRNMFMQMCVQENLTDRGVLLWPLRVSLTGLSKSPDVFDVLEILGFKEAEKRIKRAIKKLNHENTES